MTDTNQQPRPEQGEGTDVSEVVAHALAGAVLELQRLSPEKQAETGFGAQSSGSCGVTSCLFDPV
ncbi:hypothetical protein ACTWP5_05570 [Streptomyces sp. 4N509B]|uniref:hypothetical protein n=1 Tax=Streptomyces sp. 4N509B TaxID=3457413 RepID=UPI003FD2A776